MYLSTLKFLMRVRGLNQSQLARLVDLSRQNVSRWFSLHTKTINLHSRNLQSLANALNVSIESLCRPLPIAENPEERRSIETELLWDHLYPNLESFLSAALRSNPAALARLVQVYGMYGSEKIIGKQVWSRFPQYERFLPNSIRTQTKVLWMHQTKT